MYLWDRYETNELYAAERDEERSARHALTEMERVIACRHSVRTCRGVCLDCGEGIDL